jgi:hypothetical protein
MIDESTKEFIETLEILETLENILTSNNLLAEYIFYKNFPDKGVGLSPAQITDIVNEGKDNKGYTYSESQVISAIMRLIESNLHNRLTYVRSIERELESDE